MTEHGTSAPSDSPVPVAELVCQGRRYRMILPHAATDHIQRKIEAERQPYELELLQDLQERVLPGDLVIDVGANVGNHTLYLAAVAGCRVEAFEPNVELCRAIHESLRVNDLTDLVRVHHAGLGREAAKAHFESSLPQNLGAQRLEMGEGEIDVITLDSLGFAGPVKVIKIDVEGMETDVLNGGAELIARDRPLLYIECQREVDFRRVARWLEKVHYGYWDTFNVTPTHLFMPIERVSADDRLNHALNAVVAQQYRLNQHWLLLKKLHQANGRPRG